mgnify:CR=1 FL=1
MHRFHLIEHVDTLFTTVLLHVTEKILEDTETPNVLENMILSFDTLENQVELVLILNLFEMKENLPAQLRFVLDKTDSTLIENLEFKFPEFKENDLELFIASHVTKTFSIMIVKSISGRLYQNS